MLVIILVLSLLTVPAWGQEKEWNQLIAAARREGKVVVSGPPNPDIRRELPAKFKERFGIDLEYIGGRTSVLAGRLRLERRVGHYTVDVSISGTETAATIFYAEKMIEPLRPLLLPEVRDPTKWKGKKIWFYDPENKYILQLIRYVSSPLSINTRYVKPEEFKSFKDLLNPKWKGKISASDPTIHGSGGSIATMLHLTFGEEFVKRLYIGQKVQLSRNGRQLADWLARGIYPVSLSTGGSRLQRLQNDGFPVESISKLDDMPGYIGGGGYSKVSIFKPRPHPNAGRLFVNWLASKEGLEAYARGQLHPTTRVDIDESFVPPHVIIPKPGENYFEFDWDFIHKHKKRVISRMGELLGK